MGGQKYTNIQELSQEGWTITKGWPDLLYFRENEDGTLEAVFVTNRSSSRQFTMEKAATLRVMQDLGLNVRINSNGTLLTMDEFEHGGIGTLSSHGIQTIYNYRRELKALRFQLQQLTPDDPRYFQIEQRLNTKQRIVSNYEKDNAAFLTKPVAEVNLHQAANDNHPMVEYSNRLNRLLHRMRDKGREKEWTEQLVGLRKVAFEDQTSLLKKIEEDLDRMEQIAAAEQQKSPVNDQLLQIAAEELKEKEEASNVDNNKPPSSATEPPIADDKVS